MMAYGAKTDNPWVFGAGVLILVLGVIATVASLGSIVSKMMKNYRGRVNQERAAGEAVDELKTARSVGLRMIGWFAEIEFGLAFVDPE